MDNGHLLEARDLCFEAGGSRLIDGLNCQIAPGRRTMILGANGAGKSLTLRLMHGLLEPASGTVFWQGRPMVASDRLAQSMVFQRAVNLRRSVRANLDFALSVRGLGKGARKARVEDALSGAGLGPLADRAARSLSGGEGQRLAIARALIVKPKVAFFDEPTANLDPGSSAEIEGLIRKASEAGIAVVMVTHSPGQARRLAQDVIFLHGGRVVETGPAEEVLEAPETKPAQEWLRGGLYL